MTEREVVFGFGVSGWWVIAIVVGGGHVEEMSWVFSLEYAIFLKVAWNTKMYLAKKIINVFLP